MQINVTIYYYDYLFQHSIHKKNFKTTISVCNAQNNTDTDGWHKLFFFFKKKPTFYTMTV